MFSVYITLDKCHLDVFEGKTTPRQATLLVVQYRVCDFGRDQLTDNIDTNDWNQAAKQ